MGGKSVHNQTILHTRSEAKPRIHPPPEGGSFYQDDVKYIQSV